MTYVCLKVCANPVFLWHLHTSVSLCVIQCCMGKYSCNRVLLASKTKCKDKRKLFCNICTMHRQNICKRVFTHTTHIMHRLMQTQMLMVLWCVLNKKQQRTVCAFPLWGPVKICSISRWDDLLRNKTTPRKQKYHSPASALRLNCNILHYVPSLEMIFFKTNN